ncbi:MAG: hypothetical protein J5940_02325 [Clostridia bacterium]|nr:hypothetical protein [Clostridia bacterium]
MLVNTFEAIGRGKLKAVFFGASITVGASASQHDLYSWRALTTKWLRESFPDCEVTAINSSIGGTASDFAVFRVEDDVIKHSPDLVFVEFCTNDSTLNGCTLFEETIIRRIRNALPRTDAVMVRLLQRRMHEKLLRGEYCESYLSYETLAKRYGLEFLDLGAALYSHIENGDGDYGTYTKDDVHPNDVGHAILADAATAFLKAKIGVGETIPECVAPTTSDKYMSARLLRAVECRDTDFDRSKTSFYSDHGFICASEAGKSLRLRFAGTVVGIVFQIAHDSGELLWRVDGGEYARLSTWDEYALRFDRTNYSILSSDLAPGEHTLEIVCTGEKNERSDGSFVRISDFMLA